MSHICFFRLGATPLFVPDSEETFGGAEVRAYTFAAGLAQLTSNEVSFAVRGNHQLMANTADGITVLGMPDRSRGISKILRSVRRRFTARPLSYTPIAAISANIIACFGVHDPTPNVIAAARLVNKRTILFLTSSEDVDVACETGSAKQKRRDQQRRFALLHADEVVVQTDFQRTMLLERFGRTSQLIRNPVDTRISPTQLQQPREHVLWVGRADCNSKRADVCFSVARQCPDVPFRIVMNDSDSEFGKCLLSSCPANVTVEQHVPLNKIEQLYSSASVLINTSVSEGFPNAFLQAAKFATPILSLDVDPDGILEARGCGEVAGTETRMAELIREYHLRGTRIQRIAETARDYVTTYHELTDRVRELDLVCSGLAHSVSAA